MREKKEINIQIGEQVRIAREQAKMTQEMLANHINMSRSAISNWERDEAQPDFYTLRRISELLHYNFLLLRTIEQQIKSKKQGNCG